MNTSEKLSAFYARLEELYRLRCVTGLLNWDQQVFMPPQASDFRAAQLESMGRLIHQRETENQFVDLVQGLFDQLETLNDDDKVNVLETHRAVERARKLPESFVAEQSRVCALSYSAWCVARPANDFKSVAPHLTKIVELARQEADLVGYAEHPYDALLDQYEPYARLSQIKPVLTRLGEKLSRLYPRIQEKIGVVAELHGEFAEEQQRRLCERIARDVGYDFERGRLDKTHHPFESSLGPRDVRITTRYSSSNYLSTVFTTLHETGHALYELGLPERHKGTPLGSAVSLGVHESQSRLWENIVGRSPQFSRYLHGLLGEIFPDEQKRTNAEQIWQQCNKVAPSLIRVEADEVTYSLHVVVRLVLEEQLISGALSVSELPGAWDQMYQRYLGISSPHHKDGVLQDVHWYGGMLGYFPTYALGNIYAGCIYEKALSDLPGLEHGFERGEFRPLLEWLRVQVHQHGMRHKPLTLVERICGHAVNEAPFLKYLADKFGCEQHD